MQTAIERPSTAEQAPAPLPASAVADARGRGRPIRFPTRPSLLHIPLLIGAALMLFPFYWMISTSFKGIEEASGFPPTLWPTTWQFDNYVRAWQAAPFGRYFANTIFVATGQMLAVLITSSLAA